MSWTMGVDTSSTELGLGLMHGSEIVASFSRHIRGSHAEHIHQAVKFLLESNGIGARDISFLGISVGPGSFTGLRIGIAFVKGLFFGQPVAVLPISALESMAAGWHGRNRTIVAAMDARRDQVFCARFKQEGALLKRLSEDTLMPGNAFAAVCPEDSVVLTDCLGYSRSTVFDSIEPRVEKYAVEQYPAQRGLACARIAACHAGAATDWMSVIQITPLYLQPSAAEQKKEALHT
jgi:tRNA threonylcarbamoyladenosine biosynthesis protein TsaB